jgi:arsenite transporter
MSLWVGLCMVVGVALGLTAPGLMRGPRSLEFGAGSQINGPIEIVIWLMIDQGHRTRGADADVLAARR